MRKHIDAQHGIRVANQGEKTAGGQAGRGDVEDVDLQATASGWNDNGNGMRARGILKMVKKHIRRHLKKDIETP